LDWTGHFVETIDVLPEYLSTVAFGCNGNNPISFFILEEDLGLFGEKVIDLGEES